MTWFTDRLCELARHAPTAPAVIAVDPPSGAAARLDYAGLWNAAQHLAARLRAELPSGAAVLLCAPNGPEYVVAFVAALSADLRVFPVDARSASAELAAAVEQADARAVLAAPELADGLRRLQRPVIALSGLSTAPPAATLAPGPAAGLLLQSSGTTGRPKIVHRTAASLDAVARNVADAVGHRPADRVLAAIPLSHSYGIENGLLSPLVAGACVYTLRRFDPQAVPTVVADLGITILPGVPVFYELPAWTDAPARFTAGLRRAYSAGAPLPRAVFDALERRGRLRVTQLYGATEIGSVTFNEPDSPHFDPASVGPGLAGVDIRILDADDPRPDRPLPTGVEGQVAVRSPCRFCGYLGEGDSGLVEGFFFTGDLGRLDGRGALTITGRLNLLIDVGGLKVNPLEVEDALAAHPAVAECAVAPLPVSPTVNRLKAMIVPRAGAAPADDELRAFLRGRLSAHKIPRVFERRESLPRSPTGKLLRRKLLPT